MSFRPPRLRSGQARSPPGCLWIPIAAATVGGISGVDSWIFAGDSSGRPCGCWHDRQQGGRPVGMTWGAVSTSGGTFANLGARDALAPSTGLLAPDLIRTTKKFSVCCGDFAATTNRKHYNLGGAAPRLLLRRQFWYCHRCNKHTIRWNWISLDSNV